MNQICKQKGIAMHGRVFQAAWSALQRGEELSKYKIADSYHCDLRTAQRILSYLHAEKFIRISDWVFAQNSHVRIPLYKIIDEDFGPFDDVDPPTPARKDNTTYQAQRRETPEVRAGESAAKRNKRVLNNEKKKFTDNGCSMWKSVLGGLVK